MDFMLPQLFEEFMLIIGTGAGYRVVFSSVVIFLSTTITDFKFYWVISEIVILFIKVMKNHSCWVNTCYHINLY